MRDRRKVPQRLILRARLSLGFRMDVPETQKVPQRAKCCMSKRTSNRSPNQTESDKLVQAARGDLGVRSKLKRPVFLAHEMSGSEFNQQPWRLWRSGNPAEFAGFPSEGRKSAFGLFHGASFPRPLPAA
jgi:hypothetical protein